MHKTGVNWNIADVLRADSSPRWLFICIYATIMAWLKAQPTNDRISKNFRPLLSINLYVVKVANSCTTPMKIDATPGDKSVPDSLITDDPYVKKTICAVNTFRMEKIIA